MNDNVSKGAPDVDPIQGLKQLFVDRIMNNRIATGQCPVKRPVFLKPHGCVHGMFQVNPHLPESLRVGLFAQDRLPAWIRFSSDTLPFNNDAKTTVGMALKLFGVPGKKLLIGDEDAATVDLILQNHDVFFVDTAKDMYEFTYEGLVGDGYPAYFKQHPATEQIITDMQKFVPSVLTSSYWSVLPYSFGEDTYVKYLIEPAVSSQPSAVPASTSNLNYLQDDLKARLLKKEYRFRLYLQFRKDHMPLDQATVRWDTSESEPILAAEIVIPVQDTDSPGQSKYGENLSFNPWRTLQAHKPAGSISDARRVVYEASALLRRDRNGIPVAEPNTPRGFKPNEG